MDNKDSWFKEIHEYRDNKIEELENKLATIREELDELRSENKCLLEQKLEKARRLFMEYRGHFGSADYSPVDDVWCGKIEFITDLVLYESKKEEGLRKSFEEAVDWLQSLHSNL